MLGDYMPQIPNLQLGFQYFFGYKVRSGQLNADYLLPVNIGNDAVAFGEAQGNWWNFNSKPAGGASNRVDLSLGGGYRKILSDKLLVGINGFYDTSRLFNNWYSSGGAGLEMAANVGASDAFDLNANWYGNIFSSTDILNAFRNKGGSYDIEAGYSHALFNSDYDLRLKAAGYQFDTGNTVYGYKTGADLTTKNGMFTLRYEYGNDKVNGSWNNVGAFVNIGFQIENIVKGESPFTAPEPIFKSPRNLRRMLTQKVKRDWNQQYAPGRATLAAAAAGGGGGGFENCFKVNEGGFIIPWANTQILPNVSVANLSDDLWVTVSFKYYDPCEPGPAGPGFIKVGGNMSYVTSSIRFNYCDNPGPNYLPATVNLCSNTQLKLKDGQTVVNYINMDASEAGSIYDLTICFNQDVLECK